MKTITVKPVPGGWSVDQQPGDHPLMFLTGGRAEQKARELAERSRQVGEPAQVAVHDRGGRLIGQIRYEVDGASI
jgi:hypothetical protein